MTYRVIHTAPYYASPGESNRGDIRAGSTVEIVGTSGEWSQISGQDPNPWRGKWLRTFYLEEVVEGEQPEPEPEPTFEPDPFLVVERPTGERYQYALAPAELQPTILERFGLFFESILK
jgi:hypothetical protein